ncbi:MAG: YfiR family protein [Verrucomicrobiia bacterium]|jgi:hypothetical protein
MGRLLHRCLIATLGVVWLAATPLRAEVSPEYKLKAAFVFNFAKFVEWPPKAFAGDHSPLVIGVLGDNPFDTVLDEMTQGKTVNGRPVEIKRSRRVEELTGCHVIFISASEKQRQAKILAALKGSNALTVSDTDDFLESGGIIQLVMEEKKIRFDINARAAERASLQISSQLLNLARHMEEN